MTGERVLVEPGDPAAETTIGRALEESTVAMALSTVATCRTIFEVTLQYAKDREQFGKPIGSFQALKHRLADCYLAVERASALGYFAALTIAEDDPRRSVAASMAKAAAGECQRLRRARRPPAPRRHRLHVGERPPLRAEAGQGRRPPVRHRRLPPRPPRRAPRAGGVKLRYDDAVEAFRAELLEWLAANRPSPEEMAADPSVSTGHAPDWARRWTRTMFDAGWLVPGWPPERGGRNAGPIESLVFIEELAKAKVPRTTNVQGLGIVAPSIFDYGSEDQVRDYALPILRGEVTACLGMSEPGAGSDLASLSTRAVRDGDQWVINGQKVWTSGANYADFCFLFCRTDPRRAEAQGHLDRAGADGHAGHHGAAAARDRPPRAPRPQRGLPRRRAGAGHEPGRHGERRLGHGQRLARPRARHGVGGRGDGPGGVARAPARGGARRSSSASPRSERALAVDQIVQVAIDTQAARCLGYRGFAKLARGGSAPEQALMKLYASEARQHLALIAAELQGADALETGMVALDGHLAIDEPQGTWLEQYFISFANTISAGASEIQRNIIAERVLGLPRG